MMIDMNHGMEWPNGHEYQVARGSLLCQDSPGPVLGMPPRWRESILLTLPEVLGALPDRR